MYLKNSFVLRAFSLTSLTGLSQVLAFTYFAFIANILMQVELGKYVSLIASIEIFSSLFTFSLEKNLPNMNKKKLSNFILFLFLFSSIFSLFLAISIAIIFKINFFIVYTYCFIYGILKISEYINIRQGRMHLIGLVKVMQFALVFLLLLCFMQIKINANINFSTLFSIFTFSYFLNMIWYFPLTYKKIEFKGLNIKSAYIEVKDNFKFITFVTPSDFFNKAALNSPIIFVGLFFGQASAAQYALLNKLIMSPLGLIVTVIGQIFHSDFAMVNRNSNFKEAKNIFKKLNFFLGITSISFGIFLFLSFEIIIDYFFGSGWDLSKELFIYLLPLFIVMIFVSPMTSSMFVVKDFSGLFYSQLSLLIISLLSFLIIPQFYTLQMVIMIYSIASILRMFFLYFRIVKNFRLLNSDS